jgi:hypothetical protein
LRPAGKTETPIVRLSPRVPQFFVQFGILIRLLQVLPQHKLTRRSNKSSARATTKISATEISAQKSQLPKSVTAENSHAHENKQKPQLSQHSDDSTILQREPKLASKLT